MTRVGRGLLAVLLAAAGASCQAPPVADLQPVADRTRAQLVAALDAVLSQRATAVAAGDLAGIRATQAPQVQGTSADLSVRVHGLGVSSWSWTVQRISPAGPEGQLTVTAVLAYRVADDPVTSPPVTARRLITLVPDRGHPGRLLVTADAPAAAWLPWDVGPVQPTVTRYAEVLDLAHTAPQVTRQVIAGARTAAAVVTSVWGPHWRRTPVIVTVAGPADLSRLTGRPLASVAGLVAVTTADRVYLDVPAYESLTVAGRQVLLSHEVTHLASGAAADPNVPQWLKEGFADYVGFLRSPIPTSTAAADLLSQVRAGRTPVGLPPDRAFTGSGPDVGAAYAGAWLACRLIAAQLGQRALVAVYRASSAGRGTPPRNVQAALVAVSGQGTAAWTARWRGWVGRLAARPGGSR